MTSIVLSKSNFNPLCEEHYFGCEAGCSRICAWELGAPVAPAAVLKFNTFASVGIQSTFFGSTVLPSPFSIAVGISFSSFGSLSLLWILFEAQDLLQRACVGEGGAEKFSDCSGCLSEVFGFSLKLKLCFREALLVFSQPEP